MSALTENMRRLAEAKAAAEEARARVLADIGRKLQAAREAKGFTQAFVSELCGVSRSQIANIESGRFGMTVDCLMTMCSLYEVSADEVLGLKGGGDA